MALDVFHRATAAAVDAPISNALLMSLSHHWKMAMQLLQHLAGMVKLDEITQNLASESYVKGTQWPFALWLFDLDPHLPARVLPLAQWPAALETVGKGTPDRVSQAASHVASAQLWQLALDIFNQMDLTMETWHGGIGRKQITSHQNSCYQNVSFLGMMSPYVSNASITQLKVQRDERNWNDALAACQNHAWPLALQALPAMLAARLLPSSSYQAAILGSGDGVKMFKECRGSMTPAAACGTLARLLVNDPIVIHSSLVAASRALDNTWSPQEWLGKFCKSFWDGFALILPSSSCWFNVSLTLLYIELLSVRTYQSYGGPLPCWVRAMEHSILNCRMVAFSGFRV